MGKYLIILSSSFLHILLEVNLCLVSQFFLQFYRCFFLYQLENLFYRIQVHILWEFLEAYQIFIIFTTILRFLFPTTLFSTIFFNEEQSVYSLFDLCLILFFMEKMLKHYEQLLSHPFLSSNLPSINYYAILLVMVLLFISQVSLFF